MVLGSRTYFISDPAPQFFLYLGSGHIVVYIYLKEIYLNSWLSEKFNQP